MIFVSAVVYKFYQHYSKILKQTSYSRSILWLHYNMIPIIVFIELLLLCYITPIKFTYFGSGCYSMLYLQTKSNLSPDILHVSREQMHFRKETCITHTLQVKKNLDLGSSLKKKK